MSRKFLRPNRCHVYGCMSKWGHWTIEHTCYADGCLSPWSHTTEEHCCVFFGCYKRGHGAEFHRHERCTVKQCAYPNDHTTKHHDKLW